MTEWLTKNNKAMAFLRVSSHKQKDGTSHETQENRITEYCATLNLKIVETVRLVESAKDSKRRREYNAAIQRAIKNGIRHLIFFIYDRESRNLTDNEVNEAHYGKNYWQTDEQILKDQLVSEAARGWPGAVEAGPEHGFTACETIEDAFLVVAYIALIVLLMRSPLYFLAQIPFVASSLHIKQQI